MVLIQILNKTIAASHLANNQNKIKREARNTEDPRASRMRRTLKVMVVCKGKRKAHGGKLRALMGQITSNRRMKTREREMMMMILLAE